ncbi:hypothetical protein KEM63_09135 [Halopseudomonas nanhaiensis]|uniref:hypothetical protein n=1 Tax=Halopseudomonas nanhaiensis TaxID=2830842 RepID=UPI001CBE7579|nr:hypothetical protein [Halopseudomonas nanhaiensis]UAW97002.1 hypothetical protein KEM63_09135 [Halopseudomonas nanhaiensis]
MTWIIVVLVGAILVSTLHKMMPRGRQLHLHRLRDRARELGYVIDAQASKHDPRLRGCIGYRRALPRCPLDDEFTARRVDGVWQISGGGSVQGRIMTVLVSLPEAVVGLDRHGFTLVIHWNEPSDLATLEALHRALEPLAQPPVL